MRADPALIEAWSRTRSEAHDLAATAPTDTERALCKAVERDAAIRLAAARGCRLSTNTRLSAGLVAS